MAKEKKEIERIVVTHITEIITDEENKISIDVIKWNIDGKMSQEEKFDIRRMRINKDGEWNMGKGIGMSKEEVRTLSAFITDGKLKTYLDS